MIIEVYIPDGAVDDVELYCANSREVRNTLSGHCQRMVDRFVGDALDYMEQKKKVEELVANLQSAIRRFASE